MVLIAVICAIVVGVPLGVLSYWYPRAKKAILFIADVLQTIPALAVLGIIMILVGAGKNTVIIGLTLYSLLPVVRNTNLGLNEVEPGVVEAARGMGMGRLRRLLSVELPLALPVILTGVRIAAVNAVGSAVFAASVGGGGLGAIIYRGIRIMNLGLILKGTAALMVMAVILDLGMQYLGGRMDPHHQKDRRKVSSEVKPEENIMENIKL